MKKSKSDLEKTAIKFETKCGRIFIRAIMIILPLLVILVILLLFPIFVGIRAWLMALELETEE